MSSVSKAFEGYQSVVCIKGVYHYCLVRKGRIQQVIRPLTQQECDRLLSKGAA